MLRSLIVRPYPFNKGDTMKAMIRSLAVVPWLTLAIACSHTIPQYTAKPQPASQSTAPTSAAIQVPVSQLPDSALPLMLVMDLSALEQTLQTTMPEHFNEAGSTLRNDYRWDFVRDGQPQVSIQDGLVTVRTTYTGDIEGRTMARGC